MAVTAMRTKITPEEAEEATRREFAFFAKAFEQRLKPYDQQDPLPEWADGPTGWDSVIQTFLEGFSYDDIVLNAATPELAAHLIRQIALIVRQVRLAGLQADDDAAVEALMRVGARPTIPPRLSVPFQQHGRFEPWILDG